MDKKLHNEQLYRELPTSLAIWGVATLIMVILFIIIPGFV